MVNLAILEQVRKLDGYYESKYIYRADLCILETIDKHWRFVAKCFGKDQDEFIRSFTNVEQIKILDIEKMYFECFDINFRDECDFTIFNKLEKQKGIYLLYDEEQNICYIGQSRILGKRIYQSLIQKNPYTNSVTFSYFLIDDELLDLVEAVGIHYYQPILNNKIPPFKCTEKEYMDVIDLYERAKKKLYSLKLKTLVEDLL